jgi:hypothetical protein
MMFSISIRAQKIQDVFIYPTDNDKILSELLNEKEAEYGVKFVFDRNQMRARTILGVEGKTRLLSYLDDQLAPYVVEKLADDLVIIVKKELAGTFGRRKDAYIVLKANSGIKTRIRGTILDGATDEGIVGAQVLITGKNIGTVTDVDGGFYINAEAELMEFSMKFIGFQTKSVIIGFHPEVESTTFSTTLYQEIEQLKSVIVTAQAPDRNVKTTLTGVERMGIQEIKNLPTFMGEVDPIKSMTTLPGVSTQGELSSGFNVRGGESGQNLILQDNATIYNPSHLFGFFSAFNPDLVSSVVLYKGGGPAEYGSRVASVLDVSLRNGDAEKMKISGGTGLVSSRLTVEGPIKRGKSSFIVGGRVSYTDWLLKATENIELTQSSAQFYDITGKFFHSFNDNNIITLTLYNSYDDFSLASDSVFSWQTRNASILWDQTFNDKAYASLSLASSNYNSEINNLDEIEGFSYVNQINNLHLKYIFHYDPTDDYKLSAGVESIGILLEPGELTPTKPENNVLAADMSDQRSIEAAVFVQADLKLAEKLSIAAGLRFSQFFRLGGDQIYTFDFNNIEGRYPAIVDTLNYSNGELINSFSGLEPRISLRYLLSEELSLKLSYFRTYQYLHLISNTAAATPQDYWVSSGPYLKPAIGDQFSIGLFKNINKDAFSTSLELFYKTTTNAVDYIEGADITLNPSLEAGLLQGAALAYGAEVLLKKNKGDFNGWIAYTYSRSLRQFNNNMDERLIVNNGAFYPATFDQPHNLSVVANYQISKRAVFSMNFSYSTGRPITIPVSKFSYGPYLSVLNYSERNEYRIPDYHRLDLSVKVKDNPYRNSRLKGEWVISVYNAYARKNAYSITFNKYGRAKKLSILGNIFPSIAYNFTF